MGPPSFLGKEKSAKCSWFPTQYFFTRPPLIFAIPSLVIPLQIIKCNISSLDQKSVNTPYYLIYEEFSVYSESSGNSEKKKGSKYCKKTFFFY